MQNTSEGAVKPTGGFSPHDRFRVTATQDYRRPKMRLQPQEGCAECLVAGILASFSQLLQLPSLCPSPRVNNIFERLVLRHPRIVEITNALRHLCADGEYQLEAYWAERILKHESVTEANAALLTFPYHDNYVDLVRIESNAITSVTKGGRPKKYAVLGSGPLPMTSMCTMQLFRNSGEAITVANFDRDPWAITASSELCCKLGYGPEEMEFCCIDIQEQRLDMRQFDVVYLASLVGVTDNEKHDAISSIVKQMSPGALLVLRSAHSLRSLLYPV
ncbi:MAG: hypothetical protein Q9219_006202 [cf. Caloplaca sp. 3 TL-2023]